MKITFLIDSVTLQNAIFFKTRVWTRLMQHSKFLTKVLNLFAKTSNILSPRITLNTISKIYNNK